MAAGGRWTGAGAALALLASPAAAQTVGPPAPPDLTRPVQSPRDCRSTGPDEIVVCAPREERSPYRLPADPGGFDAAGPIDSVWRERERLMEGAGAGIMSCSTVGPGGWTGCDARAIKRSDEQWGHVPRSQRRPSR